MKILEPLKDDFPEAAIDIDITNSYPPLSTNKDAEVVSFVKSLTGLNATTKVAFGTEGGLFSSTAGYSNSDLRAGFHGTGAQAGRIHINRSAIQM